MDNTIFSLISGGHDTNSRGAQTDAEGRGLSLTTGSTLWIVIFVGVVYTHNYV